MEAWIDTGYPGANILVKTIKDDGFYVEQDIRDTQEWWFYWNFAISNLQQGKPIRVHFTNGEVVGPWGPAVSRDGIEWEWLGSSSLCGRDGFTYTPASDCKKIYFAFSIPYQVAHFERFINRFSRSSIVRREVLCMSEQGRPVDVIHIGHPDAPKNIIFTARHHSCESIGSYILEGTLRELLERDNPLMYPLLRQYQVHVIPFVDVDGVENGDQGKSRFPHDHNRDYTDSPIYKSTAAIIKKAQSMKKYFQIDFHSLYKWGNINDHPLFVRQLAPFDRQAIEIGRTLRSLCAEDGQKDKMIYEQIYDKTPYATWDGKLIPEDKLEKVLEDPAITPQSTSCSYFRNHNAEFAFCFESPYFGTKENKVKNTIIITVAGTLLSLFLIVTMSYPLSIKEFRGRKTIMNLLIFAMMFNGGLIPNYYLIRGIHLLDTLWALILPGSLATFNVILMINYIRSLPPSLTEAATLDGATDLQTLYYIILPMCAPIVATIALFCSVGRWNSYFNAIIYIKSQAKWTLQLTLREIVMFANSTALEGDPQDYFNIPEQCVRYAVIMVSILPIISVYPFLQKYFVKGVLVGAVKG